MRFNTHTKDMDKLIIVGTSINARHLYDFVTFYNLYDVQGFAVDKEYKDCNEFMGLPVYEIEELDTLIDKNEVYLFVAIFWNRLNADRRYVYERIKAQGYKFANIISPTAVIRGNIMGDNCWIHDNVIINSFATIKNNVMVMGGAFIGQDSVIEDHCFCAARSLIASGKVGEQSFIGLAATLFDGVVVGKKCLVGATCVVKRNMPDFSLCKSTGESSIFKQYAEDTIEEKLLYKKNVR